MASGKAALYRSVAGDGERFCFMRGFFRFFIRDYTTSGGLFRATARHVGRFFTCLVMSLHVGRKSIRYPLRAFLVGRQLGSILMCFFSSW